MMKSKKGIEMGFNWLFAIIVGAFIIFIAIYGATRLIGTGSEYSQTEAAAKLAALFSEAGISSGISYSIEFDRDTRTYYTCSEQGSFGRNTLSFSEILFDKWQDPGGRISIPNKYIFADEIVEGDLQLFSQPFFMPFKVSDLIFISSENYCFVEPPNEIEDDVSNVDNIKIIESSEECEHIRVCFTTGSSFESCSSGNDIVVVGESADFSKGSVKKNGKDLYFVDSLLYGAIFSGEKIYECNVKRLMKKLGDLIDVYEEKMNIIKCGDNLRGDFIVMENDASRLDSSSDLRGMYQVSKSIDQKNRGSVCKVFESE